MNRISDQSRGAATSDSAHVIDARSGTQLELADGQPVARRDWFACIGRPIALAGLSLLAGKLITRSVRAGCIRESSPCDQCHLHGKCELPKAIEAGPSRNSERE